MTWCSRVLAGSRFGIPISFDVCGGRRAWRVGLAARPHDLRASHATWLYDAGWSPVEIAARLGHSSASVTTKHYARRVVGRDVQIATGLHREFRRVGSGAHGPLTACGTRTSDLPVDFERA